MSTEAIVPREVALEALLGEVLREAAREPLFLLGAAPAGPAADTTLVRIARPQWPGQPDLPEWLSESDGAAAPAPLDPDEFDEILLEAFESTRDLLIGWATKQVGDRTDAEDIAQTAFMRVYARRPDIADAEEMRKYLWATAKNLVRDAWRRAAADRDRLDPAGDDRIALLADRAGFSFEDTITLRHTLFAALATLPQREREAVVLRSYEGNTYTEVAAVMGVASGTVKAYVHDALAKVRARLEVA